MAPTVLVYYSPAGRDRLEAVLDGQDIRVYPVAGRAPHAVEEIRRHPAEMVVVDADTDDISLNQAVHQLGRLLPMSLVFVVSPGREAADVYRGGHRVGVAESSDIRGFADSHGGGAGKSPA
jgi:AmiR/NasT family two-component response regulator